MEVPGVVRSVRAPDGGADMESTMRSLGDTVWMFGVCGSAGSLMDSKWVPNSSDSSKRASLEAGAKVKLLSKSNMLSEEASRRGRVSRSSELEEPCGDKVPS